MSWPTFGTLFPLRWWPPPPRAKALATASHSIASTVGYEDGENIPLGLHLDMVGRIVAAVDLPVTMDFEAGYGDAGTTARRAIEVGVVGGNLEDQMKPLDEAVAAVEAVLAAARLATLVAEKAPADVAALSALSLGGSTVEQVRTTLVGKIGENIQVRRFARFKTGEGLEKRSTNLANDVADALGQQ